METKGPKAHESHHAALAARLAVPRCAPRASTGLCPDRLTCEFHEGGGEVRAAHYHVLGAWHMVGA